MTNKIIGVLDHGSAPGGYTGPGITSANEMNVVIKSCPWCSIDCSTCWPAVQRATTIARTLPSSWRAWSKALRYCLTLRLSYHHIKKEKVKAFIYSHSTLHKLPPGISTHSVIVSSPREECSSYFAVEAIHTVPVFLSTRYPLPVMRLCQ